MSNKNMYEILNQVTAELTSETSLFAITTTEVNGIEVKSFALAPPTLRDVWSLTEPHADNNYIIYEDERWLYKDANAEVASIGNWLLANGVEPGDRIAIAMRNFPEWTLAYWGAVNVGVAVVGINAWWIEEELAFALEDSQPKILICDQQRHDRFMNIRDRFPGMRVVGVRMENPGEDVIDYAELKAFGGDQPTPDFDTDSDACIFYTSGTTGRPKGAQLTHRSCINQLMGYVLSTYVYNISSARLNGDMENDGTQPPPITIVTTPLFHVTANNCVMQPATLGGGTMVHMYKWDAREALEIIEREKVNALTGVPVMSREVLTHPDFEKFDTSSITTMGGGGAQVPPDLVLKIDDKLANGKPGTGYGMTEGSGMMCSITKDYYVANPESVGPTIAVYESKIVDENGNEVADGELGEICFKSAAIFKGYLNNPEATAETIRDGWLYTGDIARKDENGFVYIMDRAKDMLIRGGENVYCAEVESSIYKFDGIAECSVFGVPDDRLGEEVGVAIYLTPGVTMTAEDLRAHCKATMAAYKSPRYIWFLEHPLPRNASGKFLKRELKDALDTALAV